MKKFVALVLALCLCLTAAMALADGIAKEDIKFGVITLHDELSTYDKNFIDAVKQAAENLGLSEDQVKIVSGIPESDACRDEAMNLADEGYNIVFADSFGHEDYMIEAAKEFPDVQFCHATGTKAHTEGVSNFHNAFAAIYEGRYLAGIAAGMKLNELKEQGKLKGDAPLMGYVGAFTYAEVISGYTSFYLGAKSVCPDVTMKVQFTGSWYDEKEEKAAAEALIAANCDLISQHADSMGAPLPARTPISRIFPITAPPWKAAPTPSSWLPASTGRLTSSIWSTRRPPVKRSRPTGPAPSKPVPLC